MTAESDRPWTVFMGRGAPLATLFESERERMRANRARVRAANLDEDPPAVVEPDAPPAPPAA